MSTDPKYLNQSPELLYPGHRISVYGVDVPTRTGGTTRRELILHPGSVVILPILNDGHVCLIKNWRYAAGETLLELPAGTLERDEAILPAAQRELKEETGYAATDWRFLATFWVSPGVLTEKMSLFLAQDLTPGDVALDETEQIENVLLPFEAAVRLALRGSIRDAKTILGLLLWDRLRHEPPV
jgi:ADP-ribose pyrophosphatase